MLRYGSSRRRSRQERTVAERGSLRWPDGDGLVLNTSSTADNLPILRFEPVVVKGDEVRIEVDIPRQYCWGEMLLRE